MEKDLAQALKTLYDKYSGSPNQMELFQRAVEKTMEEIKSQALPSPVKSKQIVRVYLDGCYGISPPFFDVLIHLYHCRFDALWSL